jgi:hypothetical protein
MKILFLSLSTLFLSLSAFAQAPGYLADFGYQVTNYSSVSEAQSIMDLETRDTKQDSICANRATLWTYIISQKKPVQFGKVFIHLTALGEANEDGNWAYHVAPYVIVNGEEYVLDAGFSEFNGEPVPMSRWTNYFGKSEHCAVLDPQHNPAHLALEKNNLPSDDLTPLTYNGGKARQYPTTESICYIRKTPMYYSFPFQVYGADLFMSGQKQYSEFNRNEFDRNEVFDACLQARVNGLRASHSCAKYLGFNL